MSIQNRRTAGRGFHDLGKIAATAVAAVALIGCTPPTSGSVVDARQAQVAQTVASGTVISGQPVTVQGGNLPAEIVGTVAGGVLGGAAGQQVGGGRGRVIATGAGATAGAAAGQRIASAATTVQSTEWLVRLDSGRSVSVIQAEPTFAAGQRVQVVQSGGVTRLVP